MKKRDSKTVAFAALMVAFAAAPADAASIGRNIPDPCSAYLGRLSTSQTLIRNYVSTCMTGQKVMEASGQIRTLLTM